MGFLDKLKAVVSGAPTSANRRDVYPVTVRCRRCGEVLTTVVDLSNDLSIDYDREVFTVRKLISGSGANRCFQQIEVQLTFDMNKQLLERDITGGDFIDASTELSVSA